VIRTPLQTRLLAELRWHRRSIAAGVAALAVLLVVTGRAGPEHRTRPALVAIADVASGEPVPASAVAVLDVPDELVPASALVAADQAVGRPAALPLTRGEVVTDARLLGPGLLDALDREAGSEPTDLVAAPVTLADPSADGLLRVGDVVDVLAAGEAGSSDVVAERARVLRAPSRSGSLLRADEASALVLAVPSRTAVDLARAASTARLSVVLRSRSTSARVGASGVR
jgi:Flp pilus assembly protein CpaB